MNSVRVDMQTSPVPQKLGHTLHSLQHSPVKMPICIVLYFIVVGLGVLLY